MVQQKQWADTVFGMADNAMDLSTRTFDSMSEQAKDSFDIAVNSVNAFQTENRKIVDNFVTSVKNYNKMYSDACRDGLNFIKQQYTSQSTAKNSK